MQSKNKAKQSRSIPKGYWTQIIAWSIWSEELNGNIFDPGKYNVYLDEL